MGSLADDGKRRRSQSTVRILRHHVAYPSGGGNAVRRRIDLRREEGVAMTEFALDPARLHAHRRRAARLRPRLLLLDRGEPPRERDRAMGVVDRNPLTRSSTPLQQMRCQKTPARQRRTLEFTDAKVCIDFQGRPRRDADARGASAGEDLQAVHASSRSSRSARSRSGARPRCGSSASTTTPGRRSTDLGTPFGACT